jgi:hypothetical protein
MSRLLHRLSSVKNDLTALREEERHAETPITEFAFDAALAILQSAYSELDQPEPVPAPAIAPDSEGGIRIEWIGIGKNVRAVIPSGPNFRAYIYSRLDASSNIDRLSGVKLAERIRTVILTR